MKEKAITRKGKKIVNFAVDQQLDTGFYFTEVSDESKTLMSPKSQEKSLMVLVDK